MLIRTAFARLWLTPPLTILLVLSSGCYRHGTQPKTTDQSNGHGPGSGALQGSGAAMNQGHAPAEVRKGPAAKNKRTDHQDQQGQPDQQH